MTIDKALLRIEHSSMNVDDKVTADFIINTMRKYQKIEQILKEPCIISEGCYPMLKKIKRVVEDGEDDN